MGHGQYLLSSWMSSIFEECIIVFRFWARMFVFLAYSMVFWWWKATNQILPPTFTWSATFFFSVLDPPDLENIEQALLSYLFAHLHLLSSDLISSDSSPFWLLFYLSILSGVWLLNFLRLYNLYISMKEKCAPSCCNNSLRKHLSPAMSCACLLIFDEQHAPRKTGFQRANGPVSGR